MVSLLPNLRYERKFALQGLALWEMLALVRRHPAGFREAYPSRIVNNIYLDTPRLSSYHEHVDGAPSRSKTRVRWYGEPKGQIPGPILERKLKRGLVSGKMAQPLPPLFLNGNGVHPQLEKTFVAAPLSEAWRASLSFLQPSLVNSYRRHYFVSADHRFRLTVDSELSFARAAHSPATACRVHSRLIVLELKFLPEHADAAPLVTNAFPFRLVRCSKYVLGIEQTGF